jgi:hypothetical protein
MPDGNSAQQKRPIRGVEAVAERPDGTRVPFIAYPTPLFDATGRLTGAVNMLVDIRQAGRRNTGRARGAAEHAGMYVAKAQRVYWFSSCDISSPATALFHIATKDAHVE